MAEDRELFEKIAEGLTGIRRLYRGIGLIKSAYSYIGWLIPLSITLILQNIKPLAENRHLLTLLVIGVWLVSIPIIFIVFDRVFKRITLYAQTLGFRKVMGRWTGIMPLIAWFIAWIAPNLIYSALREYAGINFSEDMMGALIVLTALLIGVFSLALWEHHYYGVKISYVPATILSATLLLLFIAPITSPWNIAYGGIFLSYSVAVTLYIHQGLKIITDRH